MTTASDTILADAAERQLRKEKRFARINRASRWLDALGLGWVTPLLRIAAGDNPGEQLAEIKRGLLVPLAGITMFVVEKGTPGLSFGALEKKMGWNAQPTAQVIFEDCRVPAENLINDEGFGFKIAMMGLDGGRLNIAASSLGGATDAFERALQYAGERKAFGKSIGEFQATQFKLADMATDLEAARVFLYEAAARLDAKDPEATKFCAMAKRFVTDAGFRVANEALQIHGGYGYLKDYEIERIVRDVRVNQILEGTNEIMRVIVARDLLKEYQA